MPTYELICVMKKVSDSALKVLLRRNATYILESGAILRKMENLGVQNLPQKLSVKGSAPIDSAQFYLFEYDAAVDMSKDIVDKFKRDVEVLKWSNNLTELTPGGSLKPQRKKECTVYEDLLPPPYRPNVLKMMEKSKPKRTSQRPFNYGTGGNMDPF